ncbi:MAG TPA: thioredoxin [Acidimicrobiales bacterium]
MSVPATAIDVTDATFQAEVIDRSRDVPVVVDLWAPWCGPCKTLGPILEKVVAEAAGQVVLAKVDIDENPQIAAAFGVQSIPMVIAIRDGQPVDGFMGAYPEHVVREFVSTLLPTDDQKTIAALLAAGDEASLRQALTLDPGNPDVVISLAELLVQQGQPDEALALLARIPETDRVRRVAALARVGQQPDDDYDERLAELLDRVKADEDARREYVDLLELMGPDDPRTASYRKKLTSRLF